MDSYGSGDVNGSGGVCAHEQLCLAHQHSFKWRGLLRLYANAGGEDHGGVGLAWRGKVRLGRRGDGLSKLHRNKPAAGSLRTRLELALDFGYRSLLPLLNGLFFPDLHLGQDILDCDSTHSTLSVLKGYLRLFSGIMECVDQEA